MSRPKVDQLRARITAAHNGQMPLVSGSLTEAEEREVWNLSLDEFTEFWAPAIEIRTGRSHDTFGYRGCQCRSCAPTRSTRSTGSTRSSRSAAPRETPETRARREIQRQALIVTNANLRNLR